MKNQMQTIESSAVTAAAQRAVALAKKHHNRRLTAPEFKSAYASAVSLLGLTKGAEVDGLAAAIRAEDRADLGSVLSALTAGMEEVGGSKSVAVRLAAGGACASASVKWARVATASETADACRLILAKPAPLTTASEGTKAQYHAKQRLARAALCKLSPEFALEEAERLADAAIEYAESLRRAA